MTRRTGLSNGVLLVVVAVVLVLFTSASASASVSQLYSFGWNEYGQLGTTTNNGNSSPNFDPELVMLPGATGAPAQVSAAEGHTLVVTTSGQLYAFGENRRGELGVKTNVGTYNATPPTLVTLPGATGAVADAAAGGSEGEGFSLAVTTSGQLYTFGVNGFGQLGYTTNSGTENPNSTPTQVVLPGATGPVTQVAAGEKFSVALTSTGQVYEFGENYVGELGSTTNNLTLKPNPTPAAVTISGSTGPVTHVAAGAFFTLASTSTGQLYGYGSNYWGQLGNATNNKVTAANPTPVQISLPGASGTVSGFAAGEEDSLVVTSTGQLYSFGWNLAGELGNTTNLSDGEPNPVPTLVTLPGETGPVTEAAAGGEHSLAMTSTGQLYAFGQNELGQLGNSTNVETQEPNADPAPVTLPGPAATLSDGTGFDSFVIVERAAKASCTGDAGSITLSPGLTATAAVQTVKIKGKLSGCTGEGFKSAKYSATLKSSNALGCTVLHSPGEPVAGSAMYTWTPKAAPSAGTIELSLTETAGVLLAGEVASGSYAPLTLSGTTTSTFAGAGTCGEAGSKPVKKAKSTGTAVSLF